MEQSYPVSAPKGSRTKFIIGGLLIIAAVVYLIITSTQASAQYYVTISELKSKGAQMAGREARVSGAVIGDSIQYDAQTLTLTFVVADLPADNQTIEAQGGLAAVLHAAVENPSAERIEVVYEGVKPDLLKHEAQAIMTGKLEADGKFHASELLLKCPTKYEEAVPDQAEG